MTKEIKKAMNVVTKAYAGKYRDDGSEAITHPVFVLKLLRSLDCPQYVQVAGLYHDVLEDTPLTLEELSMENIEKTGFLVKALTKNRETPYFPQLLLASGTDPWVLIVKLADRFHNLSTISCFSYSREKKYIQETFDFVALVADYQKIKKVSKKVNYILGFLLLEIEKILWRLEKECKKT